MNIKFTSVNKIGGRDYNQDSFDATVSDVGACFVVCDGLGSYKGSEEASYVAAKTVVDKFVSATSSGLDGFADSKSMSEYLISAQKAVVKHKSKKKELESSCTTIVAMSIDSRGYGAVGHIGDSRCYFFTGNKLAFQTVDHSMAQIAVDLGQITTRDIRTHKDQNKLTRVLGGEYYTPGEFLDLTTVSVGDRFILCTDGFWEYVYEEEMEKILYSEPTPERALEEMEKLLLKRAPSYNDNYTALVVYVD